MMLISASSLIDRMEPASQEDGGGGRKVGLARLAKNHSLSGSLNSLQNVDGKPFDDKDGKLTVLVQQLIISCSSPILPLTGIIFTLYTVIYCTVSLKWLVLLSVNYYHTFQLRKFELRH